MSLINYPYTNLHELNLDWIIEQLNREGAVLSVNGKHGTVTITGEDIARSDNNSQTIEQALTSQGSSIQSVQTKIGVTALPTTAQTLTGAIAEQETDITAISNKIGTTALPTTAQTLTGAIAEQETDINSLTSQVSAIPARLKALTKTVVNGYFTLDQTDCPGMAAGKTVITNLYTNTARNVDLIFSASAGLNNTTIVYVRSLLNGFDIPDDDTEVSFNVWY